ncbi:MAG: hypothetical protein JWN61_2590 [Pseudonocardiales bacterium]|nr:hypothetical protein [Pseudonocardiales bacterium]
MKVTFEIRLLVRWTEAGRSDQEFVTRWEVADASWVPRVGEVLRLSTDTYTKPLWETCRWLEWRVTEVSFDGTMQDVAVSCADVDLNRLITDEQLRDFLVQVGDTEQLVRLGLTHAEPFMTGDGAAYTEGASPDGGATKIFRPFGPPR